MTTTTKKKREKHSLPRGITNRRSEPDYYITDSGHKIGQRLNHGVDCYDILVNGRFQCCAQIPFSTRPELVRKTVIARAFEVMPLLKHVDVRKIDIKLNSSIQPETFDICTDKATAVRLETERMEMNKAIHNITKQELQN